MIEFLMFMSLGSITVLTSFHLGAYLQKEKCDELDEVPRFIQQKQIQTPNEEKGLRKIGFIQKEDKDMDVKQVLALRNDAAKRIGDWILSGGTEKDEYVQRQIKFVKKLRKRVEKDD